MPWQTRNYDPGYPSLWKCFRFLHISVVRVKTRVVSSRAFRPGKKVPTRKQRARYVRNSFTGDCSQAVSRSRQECSRAKDTAQIVASSTRKERALRFILLIVSICSFPLRNQGGLRKLSSRSYCTRIPVTAIFFQEG